MKNLRYILIVSALAISAALSLATGCGGQIIPAPPAEIPEPVTINYLDGGKGVPVDSTFKYIFSRPVKASTVNTSTFFMVKHEPPIPDPICDPSYAIGATVESLSDTEFVLTPTDPLEYDTTYTICLTQEIQYATGEQFEGVTATFTTEVEGPLSLNTLDGAVDIPVDSTFRYRFLREVDASTVNDSTYFIVPVQPSASINKATLDPAVCNPVNAIDSEVSCTQWSCTIEPAEILDYLYNYTACLTSDIEYAVSGQTVGQLEIQSQASFDGFMAGFTTAQWIISSIKLVRLDGTELDLSDRPIPRMVHIRYTFSSAADRAAFEEAVSLIDEDGVPIDGTYEWAADDLSTTFIPIHRFEYGTEYTIDVNTGVLPMLSVSKALENVDLSFTTMIKMDVNGDGFADVLVGAWNYISGSGVGRAYIFTGSGEGVQECDLSQGCTAHTTFTGTTDLVEPFYLGTSPNIIGDVNADGFADVIIDADGADGGGIDRGEVYVFLGGSEGIGNCNFSSNPPCKPDVSIRGEADYDYLGWIASNGAGDVNGDGYDDIIIGASYANAGGTYRGKAYIFLGGESFLGELSAGNADTIIVGAEDWDSVGSAVSEAGDVNGDGFDDVIVGAPWADGGGSERGAAYLFLGAEEGIPDCNLSASCTPSATILGAVDDSLLGTALSYAGDMNGDGYDDVLLGAPYASTDGKTSNGNAYIIGGSPNGIADCDLAGGCTPLARIYGESDNVNLGFSLSGADDVNGDGYGDVVIGIKKYEVSRGRSCVFTGGPDFSGSLKASDAEATMTGLVGDYFSYNCGEAGDVDGDGYDDLIIGASYASTGADHKGRAYIFEGGPELVGDFPSDDAQTILTGGNDLDRFGAVY